MKKIHIDRLEIRLRGASRHLAHEAAAGLGPELMEQLRPQTESLGSRRDLRRLDAGTVKTPAGVSAKELRQSMAERIARAVRLQGLGAKEDR